MSILVHKAGIGKTTGQKSNPSRTTEDGSTIDHLQPDFMSFFDPSSGITTSGGTTTWSPSSGASSLKLRLFNSPSVTSGPPSYISFDGSDDHIGPTSTGYGGNPIKLDNVYWTIGFWAYAKWSTNTTHLLGAFNYFGVEDVTIPGFYIQVDNVGDMIVIGANNLDSISASNTTLLDNKWSFISLSYETGVYYLYVNGRFVASGNNPDTLSSSSALFSPLTFGAYPPSTGFDPLFNGNSTLRLGRIYYFRTAVLADRLLASKHRFLFLASHDMHNGKYYGSDVASYV
jgi:hypothetical protein